MRIKAMVALAAGLGAGCGSVMPSGGELPGPAEAFGGLQCSALRPQTEPDLVGWDPASRAKLTTLREQGVIVVRYEATGCDARLEVLSDCIGAGTYVAGRRWSLRDYERGEW